MKFGFWFSVKFRAFLITFGTVSKGVVVEWLPSGVPKWQIVETAPTKAHQVLNDRGVVVKVWQG